MILITIETTIIQEIIIDKININQNSSSHTNQRISIQEMINMMIINKIILNVDMTTIIEDVMITTMIGITMTNKTTPMINMKMLMIGITIELKVPLSSKEAEDEAGAEVVVEATEAATIKTTTEGISTRLHISRETMINTL